MGREQINYSFCDDDGDFDIEATIDGVRAGYVRCVRERDRLLLADLLVLEKVSRNWPLFPRLFLTLLGERRPWCLRGTGIGRELLMRLLRQADAAGVREIWGSVTHEDIRQTPHLLDWYERHGFVILVPDGECVKGAAKKIVRRR